MGGEVLPPTWARVGPGSFEDSTEPPWSHSGLGDSALREQELSDHCQGSQGLGQWRHKIGEGRGLCLGSHVTKGWHQPEEESCLAFWERMD